MACPAPPSCLEARLHVKKNVADGIHPSQLVVAPGIRCYKVLQHLVICSQCLICRRVGRLPQESDAVLLFHQLTERVVCKDGLPGNRNSYIKTHKHMHTPAEVQRNCTIIAVLASTTLSTSASVVAAMSAHTSTGDCRSRQILLLPSTSLRLLCYLITYLRPMNLEYSLNDQLSQAWARLPASQGIHDTST